MSEKRYPTRMHEVLGVEPEERFEIPNYVGEVYVDNYGYLFSVFENDFVCGARVCEAINHPDRLTRRPRLTEEQVQALKAATLLGLRYLVKDDDGYVVGYGMEPYKLDDEWFGAHDDEMIFSGIENGAIAGLLSCADSSPLDIVQVLRQNGVEVDNGQVQLS